MKPSYTELPVGYGEILAVDLQKNKKLAILINVAAVLISAVMAVAAVFFVPISTLFDVSEGLGVYLLRMGVLMVGLVAYIVLHELVHGVTMRLCGTKKIKYGFTGLYAFAGSTDYYSKKSVHLDRACARRRLGRRARRAVCVLAAKLVLGSVRDPDL